MGKYINRHSGKDIFYATILCWLVHLVRKSIFRDYYKTMMGNESIKGIQYCR